MADEQAPEGEQPQAPQPDTAAELAQARAEADAARRQAAESQAARERSESESRRQMAELATAAREALIQSGMSSQPPPDTSDDDGIITKRELAKHMDELRMTMAQATLGSMQQENANTWRSQREINRRLAASDPDMEYFADLAPDINAIVDGLPPKAQAQPGIYREIYNLVLGRKHKDVSAKVAAKAVEAYKAEQARLASDGDDGYYEPEVAPAAPPPPRREPPMPRADGTRSAVSAPGRRMPRLSEDDRFVVNRYFDGDTAAYLRAREQPDTDMFKPREPRK